MADDLADVREAQARGTINALGAIGNHLHSYAATIGAPIEEGTLRASGEVAYLVNGQRFEGPGAQAAATAEAVRLARAGDLRSLDTEVSFNTVYAAYQHEREDLVHPLGGHAKYLERPLVENAARYDGIIGRAQAVEVSRIGR